MPKQHICMATSRRLIPVVDQLLGDFRSWLEVNWTPREDLAMAANEAVAACSGSEMPSPQARSEHLFALVNSKLKLNRCHLQRFLDAAAIRGIFPNYHDKAELLRLLDYADGASLANWLQSRRYDENLSHSFEPITRAESLSALHDQLRTGFVKRSDARDATPEERREQVLSALFGSYIFRSFPARTMHAHFNGDCRSEYFDDFYKHLLRFHPRGLCRDCALIFLKIDEALRGNCEPRELRNRLCGFINGAYERLANHCFFAILIKPFVEDGESGEWRLFSDLILYAEKHREVELEAGYFRSDDVERATVAHVPEIDLRAAQFRIANEGFFFRAL